MFQNGLPKAEVTPQQLNEMTDNDFLAYFKKYPWKQQWDPVTWIHKEERFSLISSEAIRQHNYIFKYTVGVPNLLQEIPVALHL